MARPRHISSGEAMHWNEDMNRRRLAYHQQRCAEDPMYRKAYEYLQEQERKMMKPQEMTNPISIPIAVFFK